MTLGEFIASRRKYLHLTQEELADKLYVSKSAVAKWETDGGIPDRDNLKRLAGEIGVMVDDLYRMIRDKQENAEDLKVNITSDVIDVLESYGYTVIRPKGEQSSMIKRKDDDNDIL